MSRECLYCGREVDVLKPFLCSLYDNWLWMEADAIHLAPAWRARVMTAWCDRNCLSLWATEHAKRDLEFIAEEEAQA